MSVAAQTFTKSVLMGLDAGNSKSEFSELTAEDIENLPFDEAVEYLKKRNVINKTDYYALSNKMKFRAFTVSRIADGATLSKINSEMIKNVRDGNGLKDFLNLTKTELMDKVGLGQNKGWYWETVYRTNIQTAYNAGRAMGFEENPPVALQFIGIEDERQTDVCHSLNNIIRPYGDNFWKSHWPPLHFNCRSTVRAIYDEDEVPENYSVVDKTDNPTKGFGSYPLANDNWWDELKSQIKQATAYGVQTEIEEAGQILGVNTYREELEKKMTQAIKDKQPPVPERVYGYGQMNIKKKRNAVFDWLIRKGMASKKERFVITDTKGNIESIRKGNETSVTLGNKVKSLLSNADKDKFIFSHNHPGSSSFSFADANVLNKFPSLKEMIAVGHDGTIYSLKAGRRLSKSAFNLLIYEHNESNFIEALVKKYKWKYNIMQR